MPCPAGFADELAALLAEGRREDVVSELLTVAAGVTADRLTHMKALPSWPNRVAAAHTVVREIRAHDAYRFRPERFGSLTAPTLLLAGSESLPAEAESTAVLAAALPRARVITLAGEGHVAMLTAPELFTAEVLDFLRGEAARAAV